ncbi:MAG: phage tail protein [Allosphingosinicella sp.]|uniref:phage tail protein n=1 Tax=Allosphingosinicella sp. TaxID=2823234 RepID=UPI0039429099
MNKHKSLKQLLHGAIPGIAANPEKLQMFVDEGGPITQPSPSLYFEQRYRLNIVLLEFTGDLNLVFVPLLAWIHAHQPDLIERRDRGGKPFEWKADVLDGDAFDLSIDIELSERVKVERRPNGGFEVTYLPEPEREDPFGGPHPWTLFGRDIVAGSEERLHGPEV